MTIIWTVMRIHSVQLRQWGIQIGNGNLRHPPKKANTWWTMCPISEVNDCQQIFPFESMRITLITCHKSTPLRRMKKWNLVPLSIRHPLVPPNRCSAVDDPPRGNCLWLVRPWLSVVAILVLKIMISIPFKTLLWILGPLRRYKKKRIIVRKKKIWWTMCRLVARCDPMWTNLFVFWSMPMRICLRWIPLPKMAFWILDPLWIIRRKWEMP
mmetsp:Transcript_44630/g.107537  ORF Transcript_44630/g.107537 Transcript_44630/m.107537 type:complete len:211 (-) Transcript_44630:1739-2371(-)